jgi:NAD(P)-dependent dehydrogenase (short-subunit alcohol dehydrogenase family)
MPRLEDRVALVTGAASGIGSACALRFAQEGARVAGIDASDRRDDSWQEAERIASASHFAVADVRDEAALAAAIAAVAAQLGRIDILVNSAGVAGGGPVHLMSVEEWNRVLDVNLKGTFLACKHVIPVMMTQGRGSIVNIASVEGLEASEGGSAYNASKAGVVLLTRNMAMDYARRGIRVNAICPGFIDTPMLRQVMDLPGLEPFFERIVEAHQLRRLGRPEEVANAALFLACDESSFVTGHALAVDGGFTAGHRFGVSKLMGLE